jgi:outer membrane protein assembly factor BamA
MRRSSLTIVPLFLFASLTAVSQNLGELTISGLKRTDEQFIRKVIESRAGQPLDSLQMAQDILRLKRLEPVASADFAVTMLPDGNFRVDYNIVENFTIIPGFNVYTTQNEEVAWRVSLFDFNFLGQNHIVGGFFLRDIFNSYGVYYEAPFLFNREWGLSVNHTNNTRLEPVFFPENTTDFKYNNNAFEAFAIYQPDFNNRFEFGGSYFEESYEYLEQEGALPPPITQVSGNHFRLRARHLNTNVDIQYQYLEGREYETVLNLTNEANENLSNFFLGRFNFRYYKRLGERGNFAHRFQGFFASNNDAIFAPFVLDNNLNIRGVGNKIDRGTAGIVLNTEYRHTLYERDWFVIQSNVFVDAGSWRNPGGDLSDLVDPDNIRFHPGLGIRFIHKRIFNAVVRIDYGYGIGKGDARGFVIGIGQYF